MMDSTADEPLRAKRLDTVGVGFSSHLISACSGVINGWAWGIRLIDPLGPSSPKLFHSPQVVGSWLFNGLGGEMKAINIDCLISMMG